MSDSGKERKSKRSPTPAAGDDPWAKWRQPEATPAAVAEASPAAQEVPAKAEIPAAPKPRERPTGTLSPRKPAAPARVDCEKTHTKGRRPQHRPRAFMTSRGAARHAMRVRRVPSVRPLPYRRRAIRPMRRPASDSPR